MEPINPPGTLATKDGRGGLMFSPADNKYLVGRPLGLYHLRDASGAVVAVARGPGPGHDDEGYDWRPDDEGEPGAAAGAVAAPPVDQSPAAQAARAAGAHSTSSPLASAGGTDTSWAASVTRVHGGPGHATPSAKPAASRAPTPVPLAAPRARAPANTAEIDASWKASVQRVFGAAQAPGQEPGR
ncbi:hypothetical protein [Roseomonas indoligenes]|uniref:Uncharacterized protein n=1 Tax=Roseomonas indoligenes TaxID=2820811 RepID=A0A940MV29_9PROT|nr:hypothetical protein [Pararoseomonas indoligenes]MBP0493984.1 hypothetical protein [Pararoseomonas indoligenes]